MVSIVFRNDQAGVVAYAADDHSLGLFPRSRTESGVSYVTRRANLTRGLVPVQRPRLLSSSAAHQPMITVSYLYAVTLTFRLLVNC
jgi:hypothetical protein